MKVVLDTNVLVSGFLTPFGACGEIVRLVASGSLILQYDARIFSEYREVLHRPKFQFDRDAIAAFLAFVVQSGQIPPAGPLKRGLPDPDDEPFLEVAIAGKADCLVTGNKSHFPAASRQGARVLSPKEFQDYYRHYVSAADD